MIIIVILITIFIMIRLVSLKIIFFNISAYVSVYIFSNYNGDIDSDIYYDYV